MSRSSLLLAVLACAAAVVSAANILALLPTASPSHHIWNSPLMLALERRGHNLTVVGPQRTKGAGPNLTDLVVDDLYAAVAAGFNYEEMAETPIHAWITEAYNFFGEGCRIMLHSPAFRRLVDYPLDTRFDLLLIESSGAECLLGVWSKFGRPPIVAINAFGIQQWVRETAGSPSIPSFMPQPNAIFSHAMSFAERVQNTCFHVFAYILYHYRFLPWMDSLALGYFGPGLPPAGSVMAQVSISMSNFNPVLDYPLPHTPNIIPVAGLQIGEPRPLPADLQQFMDGAADGVVFFSLGSNVRSDKLAPAKRRAILDAFARLAPCRVLWKFESDGLGELPENLKIGKWLPQTDILAHPKARVFVSHCGALSTHEAVHRGVPVVGIPFLVDQHINIRKLAHHGAGRLVEYRDLTADSLFAAIEDVLQNNSYQENMRALSARFRDFPDTPLDRAVFWTEYVIRHKGARHLRPASLDLSLAQYFLLDVIAAALAVPVVLVLLLKLLCCRKKSRNPKKPKQS